MKRDVREFTFVCGNDIFTKLEPYKRLESARLGHGQGPFSAELLTYIPTVTDPVKIVCFNVHIFQDANGQGNYLESESGRLHQITDWANNHYEFPEPQSDSYPSAPVLTDTRIRFKMNRIEFYKDSALFTSYNVFDLQAAAVARNPTTLDQVNVYITKGNYPAAGFAQMPAPGVESWVVLLGGAVSQSNPVWLNADYVRSETLSHEFGHVLDLSHTYSSSSGGAACTINSDFLSDVFGLSPSTCPHLVSWAVDPHIQEPLLPNTVITNNLMGGNNDNYWVSRLQAAMMHRALTEKSVKRYVATGCRDCVRCVAFMVRGYDHVSQGGDTIPYYQHVELNESWCWNTQSFVTPVSGVYHFDVSFVKDVNGTSGSDCDALIAIQRNGAFLGRARSGNGAGTRGTGSVSLNTRLGRGDVVTTVVQSVGGPPRHLLEYNFSGHLVCGC